MQLFDWSETILLNFLLGNSRRSNGQLNQTVTYTNIEIIASST